MTGFANEHRGPLVGSAVLHLLVIVLVAGASLKWTTSQPPVQLAIEGVVVDARDLPRSVRSGKALEMPQPRAQPRLSEPTPPAVDERARDRAAEEAAAAAHAEKERAAAEARRKAEAERKQAADAEAQRRRAAELEKQKKQADARAASEARAKAEAEAKARREAEARAKAAAEQKAAAEAKARSAADAKAKAAREADLQRRLAAEEEEGAAMARSGVVDEYRALLVQTIERNWIRPPSARAGLSCTLNVTQATGGTVTDVKIGACNGDAAVRESIVNAVYRASPLPAPRDPRAFERRLEIVFKPTE